MSITSWVAVKELLWELPKMREGASDFGCPSNSGPTIWGLLEPVTLMGVFLQIGVLQREF